MLATLRYRVHGRHRRRARGSRRMLMDPQQFDTLVKTASSSGTRRALVRLCGLLPLGMAVAALLGSPDASAADDDHGSAHRRRRRKTRHKHNKNTVRRNKQHKNRKPNRPNNLNPPNPPAPPPVPGCLPPSATGTTQGLQEAIAAAAVGSTVTLCAGTWNLTSTVNIGKALILAGAGAGQTILDGQNAVQVLRTTSGPGVELRDLTITKGNADQGAGIWNEGTLTLVGVTITSNTATADAGGIFNFGGTVRLQHGSRVTGNTATGSGGGIVNFGGGTVTLQDDSRVAGNTATEGGGIYNSNNGSVSMEAGSIVGGDTAADANSAMFGGGIYNSEFGGVLILQNGSRISGNIATQNGGGIANSGTLTMEAGSTVGGDTAAEANSANVLGGGIYNAGTVTLENGSRVVGNTSGDTGGGIYNDGGTVNVADQALVCNNTPADDQCAGDPPSTGQCPNPADGVCPA
jgi:hypothetical protein